MVKLRKGIYRAVAFVVLWLLMGMTGVLAQTYTIVDLGGFNNGYSVANDINDSGQIVGLSQGRAFLYENGIMINLGVSEPQDTFSGAVAINNNGVVVGNSHSGTSPVHGFIYKNGLLTNIHTLVPGATSATSLQVYDINDNGQIVGNGDVPGYDFIFSNGTILTQYGGTDIFGGRKINDKGQILEDFGSSDGTIGAILNPNGIRVRVYALPGGTSGNVTDINNSGQVVGISGSFAGDRAFLYDNGTMTNLGVLPTYSYSRATGINDKGQIIGYSYNPGDTAFNTGSAFLYHHGLMIDLNTLLPINSGWVIHRASAINNNGEIVGYGYHNGVQHAFLMTPARDSSISGQVKNSSGDILPGARVQVRKNGVILGDVLIDGSGNYQFTNLPAGVYQVSVNKAGFYAGYQTLNIQAGQTTTADFALVPIQTGTSPRASKRKVILIRGTNNASKFEDALVPALEQAGYRNGKPGETGDDILVTDLSDTGYRSITDSVHFIHAAILKEKKEKWGGENTNVEVDIIAHSAGGLAAREFINKANIISPPDQLLPTNVRPLVKVKNLITLGTPLGGTYGAGILGPGSILFSKPILRNMSPGLVIDNPKYGDASGIKYWKIGGDTEEPRDGLLYLGGSAAEPELQDGLVNVRSVLGQRPWREKNPPCLPDYRILHYNHGNLVKSLEVIQDYILPVLRGEGWDSCGTEGFPYGVGSRMARTFAAQPGVKQLVETTNVALNEGVLHTTTVPIDTAEEAKFTVVADATATVTLEKPDGTVITVATVDPEVAYETATDESGLHAHVFTVTNPAVGNWKINILPTTVPENGGTAAIVVSVKDNLSLSGEGDATEYPNGATPQLTATLTEEGAPLTGATVNAVLAKEGSSTVTVTLLDDGAHNDGAANDGVYGGSPAALADGGVYNIRFQANGNTTSSEAFQRVAFDFFTVAPESASLSKTYTDEGVDYDEDDVFEQLRVNAGVSVAQAGDYLVEADLKDGEGNLIASALGTAKNLQPGQRTVAILFDGQTILQHGKPGPYKVDNVRLYADTEERPIWIETDADGDTTQAYTLAQFDHPPAVIVLQPDETNPVADSSFDVIVQATDEDTPATVNVYYDTDADGNGGTLISENLTADGEHVVTWDTSAIPEGAYHIYAVASDGIRPAVTSVSPGVVQVQHGGGEPVAIQPDLLIKTDEQGDGLYGINNEYQTIPAGEQVESLTVANGQVQLFQVKVENDGGEARSFVLKAQESQATGYTTAYAVGATNITTAIRGAGYPTASLEPGEFIVVEVAVTASGVAPGTEKSIVVEAFRDGDDTTVRDAVAILKEAALPPQNTPPVLNAIGNKTVQEGAELAFEVGATDTDVPAQTLEFSATGLPDGASFDAATRVFSWTPGEAQGPGSYEVTFKVGDGQAQGSETVTLTVQEANEAPVLNAIGNKTAVAGSTLSFTATATDSDLPAQALAYSLVDAPAGAAINATSGAFSWTPPAQGNGGWQDLLAELLRRLYGLPPRPQSYTFKVRVWDGLANDEEEITVSVVQGSAAPVLKAIGSKQVNEKATLDFTLHATDKDSPAHRLVYSAQGLPAGASFNTSTRRFWWRPTEAQGPGTYQVTFTVSDGTSQDSETVTIVVREVNFAPFLSKIGDKTVKAGNTLTFTARAMDVDVPVQALTYSLQDAPAGAVINPATGVFSWTAPTQSDGGWPNSRPKNIWELLEALKRAQAKQTYTFRVKVSDGVVSDEEKITVKVN